MKKKALALLLTIGTVFACALGLGACNAEEGDRGTKGLSYELIEGENEYRVLGRGEAEDTHVVIPATYNGLPVTEIWEQAFKDAYIESITIGSNVTSIGNYAFYNCGRLTEISLPNGVKSISATSFLGCNNLPYTIEGSCKYLGNGNNPYLFLADVTSTYVTTVAINAQCKIIGNEAFSSCSSLTSVHLPNGLTTIGESAFSHCGSLTEIILPNSVTSIDNYAFAYCSGLTEIVLSNNVESLGAYAFTGCSKVAIYCEAVSKPNGWHAAWNADNRPVVWDCNNQ